MNISNFFSTCSVTQTLIGSRLSVKQDETLFKTSADVLESINKHRSTICDTLCSKLMTANVADTTNGKMKKANTRPGSRLNRRQRFAACGFTAFPMSKTGVIPPNKKVPHKHPS